MNEKLKLLLHLSIAPSTIPTRKAPLWVSRAQMCFRREISSGDRSRPNLKGNF